MFAGMAPVSLMRGASGHQGPVQHGQWPLGDGSGSFWTFLPASFANYKVYIYIYYPYRCGSCYVCMCVCGGVSVRWRLRRTFSAYDVEKEREREGEVSSNLTKSDTMIQSVNYTIKHVGSERLEYLSMELVHSTWEAQSQWLTRAVAGVQEKVEAKRYSFNSTFPSLPSVMKARKRREDAPKKMYEDVIANLIQALLPAEVYRRL